MALTSAIMTDETGQKIIESLNAINQNILDKKVLEAKLERLTANNAGAHNSIYRGKDLTNIYSITQIADMVKTGDLSDLYIGDYITASVTSKYRTENVDFMVAGFNIQKNNGDADLTANNATIVMRDCFTDLHRMNATNTTEGGYYNSEFVGKMADGAPLTNYVNALRSLFGARILKRRAFLSNATSGRTVTAGAWYDEYAGLMTQAEVYGHTAIVGTIGWQEAYDIGCDQMQLPLFALDPHAKIARQGRGGERMWYWLRDVVESTYFAGCGGDGVAGDGGASSSGGVRLRFLIG